jgi:hypothetical protein
MQRTLICPGERPGVSFLAQSLPLVGVPMLGQPVLGCWLEWLAATGVKEVLVLATDRPEFVRALVGDGSRWGLRVEVRAELRELSPAEVLEQSATPSGAEAAAASTSVTVVDHLPGLPEWPLFRHYQGWYASVLAWLALGEKMSRIGLRQIQPGVWCGLQAHLSPDVKLLPPCWIGDQVRVGPHTVIGPNAVLENRVVIDAAVEVCSSIVGPDTFVGTLTRIENAIAWGNTLIDWRTGSCTQVPDAFLLSALSQRGVTKAALAQPGGMESGFWDALLRPRETLTALMGKLRRG